MPEFDERVRHGPMQCGQCGERFPAMFSLKNAVWDSVALRHEMLCLSCVERRLGRKVTWSDLNPSAGLTKDMILGLRIFFNSPKDLPTELFRSEVCPGSEKSC